MSTVVKRESTLHEFPRRAELSAVASKSELFFNRELSLLEFHARVLEEAVDARNPLLERLKFLSIFSSNLDEFFMIRISGLKEELDDVNVLSLDGLTPSQQLAKTRERILDLVNNQARCLREEILPQLKEAGIALIRYESLSRHVARTGGRVLSYFMTFGDFLTVIEAPGETQMQPCCGSFRRYQRSAHLFGDDLNRSEGRFCGGERLGAGVPLAGRGLNSARY